MAVDDVRLKAALATYQLLSMTMDPENKARLTDWLIDAVNQSELLFSSTLSLDTEALAEHAAQQEELMQASMMMDAAGGEGGGWRGWRCCWATEADGWHGQGEAAELQAGEWRGQEVMPDIKHGRRLLGLSDEKVSDEDDEAQLMQLYPVDEDGNLLIPMIDGTIAKRPLRFH